MGKAAGLQAWGQKPVRELEPDPSVRMSLLE